MSLFKVVALCIAMMASLCAIGGMVKSSIGAHHMVSGQLFENAGRG